MLPNLIIAGVPKAATSTLFRWLSDHPQVGGSSEKETYYFVDPGTHMFRADRNIRETGFGGYEQFFNCCSPSAKVILEATPSYLYSKTALSELTRLPSRPQFLFVLREPVSQLRSLFAYFQNNWNWIPRDMDFSAFIAAAAEGREQFGGNELACDALVNAWYPYHLRRWRAAVGDERMLIFLFDELVSDRVAFMRRLALRVGIDADFYDDYDFPSENVTYAARSAALQSLNIRLRGKLPRGPLYELLRRVYRRLNTRPVTLGQERARDPAVEQRLAEHFAPMLAELERDFGLDVSPWRSHTGAATSAARLLPQSPQRDAGPAGQAEEGP